MDPSYASSAHFFMPRVKIPPKRHGEPRGRANGSSGGHPAAAGVHFISGLRQNMNISKGLTGQKEKLCIRRENLNEFSCLVALSQRPERAGFTCLKQQPVKRSENGEQKSLRVVTAGSLLSDVTFQLLEYYFNEVLVFSLRALGDLHPPASLVSATQKRKKAAGATQVKESEAKDGG